MINSYWNYSMISKDDYIFSIGRCNSNKYEGFNLKAMKQAELPDLNYGERQRPILEIYNNYLYIFMGYTQYNILDSIERMEIDNLEISKCEKLAFKNPENMNTKFFGAGIYNLDSTLFFFGGKFGKGDEDYDYRWETNYSILKKCNFALLEYFVMDD